MKTHKAVTALTATMFIVSMTVIVLLTISLQTVGELLDSVWPWMVDMFKDVILATMILIST
jgi:hypothetical protein